VPRYPSRLHHVSYSFGPGPITPAVKALLVANVVFFVVQFLYPGIADWLGLSPELVLRRYWLWQPVTYMFLHGDLFHILFNMLALWMLGVELERTWGTREFLRYYFVSGVGAALTTLLVALLPFGFAGPVWLSLTVGASGAIYGLLLAYAYYYPTRPMLFFPIPIPIPAKYFVIILGAIAFLSSLGGRATGVAHATHLGGLVAGYLYLTRGRGGLSGELKYRWLKWKMGRMRRRFDVVQGGRPKGWDERVH
jgi:membrane associated rhomboid family serine protease